MATVQFKGNSIEVETVNYSGHLFSDFYAYKSPQTGPGWYIMGRNSEKYGTLPNGKGAYVMLCARPDLKARAHPHYNGQIRRGMSQCSVERNGQMEKITLRIPQGANIGSEQKPIYGYKEIEAIAKGGLAVHRINGDSGPWTVTHIKSLLRISVLGSKSKKRAIQNMEKALALNFDWNLPEKETLDAMRATHGIRNSLIAIGDE